MESYEVVREAYPLVYFEQVAFKDSYGGVDGLVFMEAYRMEPKGVPSDTVLLFMHPVGGGGYLPMVTALAAAGNHVIYANSHYRGNDSALIMEKVVTDLACAVRDARERLGYERVVLAGWSGGGSLSLFYQQQAERPSVTSTPAGDPPDLAEAGLTPADGLLLLAAHPSRHQVLCDCIDAAVLDEGDIDARDPELDLFDPRNPAPYAPEFVARYRAAQAARVRRITADVKERLETLRAGGRPHAEHGFVVPGTMADPRTFDTTLDPNERVAGETFIGPPQTANNGPIGLARFSTLRSWLSQWSLDDANGDGIRAAADVTVPALVVAGGADNICTPSYTEGMFDALGSEDKRYEVIPGATHYYFGEGQDTRLVAAVELCTAWLAERGLSPAG